MSQQHHDGRITAGELTTVCSHYDLGAIRHVSRLKAGSRSAPKIVLVSDKGTFLLKRRAPGNASNPRTVALTHEVMLHLEGLGLPAPELVGTRTGNNSMLQLASVAGESLPAGATRVYEVYRFIQGRPYDRSEADADAAGMLLARLHRALADFQTNWPALRGSYLCQPSVAPALRELPARLDAANPSGAQHDVAVRERLLRLCAELADRYERASAAAKAAGIPERDVQIVHADWHPGNVLFREAAPQSLSVGRSHVAPARALDAAHRIAAILDFDSIRIAPRLTDVVNGAMQFALGRSSMNADSPAAHDPSTPRADTPHAEAWRIGIDQNLLRAFYRGYRKESGLPLTPEEAAQVGGMMIQALIVEAVSPIAATGRFGKLDPLAVLEVVGRAVRQLANAQNELVSTVVGP